MITFDSEPCDEQREVMEGLGFETVKTNREGFSCWAKHLIFEDKIIQRIDLAFRDSDIPQMDDILFDIERRGCRRGQDEHRNKVRDFFVNECGMSGPTHFHGGSYR